MLICPFAANSIAYSEMRLKLARIEWNFDMHLTDDSHGLVENSKVYYLGWEKALMVARFTPRSTSNDS